MNVRKTVKKTLADALETRGYDVLTPVQEAVTNPEYAGSDLLVSAQTGSGKTVGFGLAIAPTILGDDDKFTAAGSPLALVIAPTRELALQVKRELSWLFANAATVVASCVGGMDMRDERRALGRGAHIVVATPGRLRDHIMRGSIDLSKLKAVVLDEADEMLDLGFREDLEFILGESPESRQTLMFSATVPASIAKLAKSYQRDAVRVVSKSESSQHADIEYQAYAVSMRDSENAIINTLRFHEAPNAIVFCNTRAMVNRLTTRLSNRGFAVVALSGELSQSERTHALQAMRDGRARVCVATDVAARGIDLPNLDLVVHAELPTNHETLLHRSGRTGRAGRKGVSTLIVPPKSRKKAERILASAKLKATWSEAPSADAVRSRDEERMLADPVWTEEITKSTKASIDQLVEKFTPQQIANAYLKLFHANHTAAEELAAADAAPKPREKFGPSTWFSVAGGRAKNAEPRRLLPMLCTLGDITKDDIGAIRIQQDRSFFEIRQASVARFLKAIGEDMKLEAGAVMTKLSAPPDFAGAGRDGPRPTPTHQSRGPKPGTGKPRDRGTTVPVDWNDEPKARVRKPKPGHNSAKPNRWQKADSAVENDGRPPAVSKRKPDSPGAKRPKRAADERKGPPPPKGKTSSKKNRTRKVAAKAAKMARGKSKETRGGKP